MTDMLKGKQEREMQVRSGSVSSSLPLVDFLYDLLRDHLPIGTVEGLMYDVEVARGKVSNYTNGYLAQYAQDIAKRLGHEDAGMSEFESRVRNNVLITKEKLSGAPGPDSDRALKHWFMEGIFHIVKDTPE